MFFLQKKGLSRRDFLKGAGSAFAAIGLSGCASFAGADADGKKKRPNVVFILADDMGYTGLSCTGSDLYQTPNIDRLARESMYFDHAFSSHPSCAPSRAAILTGKYPARMGIISHGAIGKIDGELNMPSEEVTIAEALKANGYKTCHIGKWHVGLEGHRPEDQGFDIALADNHFCCPPNHYFYPFKSKSRPESNVPDLEGYKKGDQMTDCLSDLAVKFIDSNKDSDQPFFLNLWYYAVHSPVGAKEEKIEKYEKLVKPGMIHKNAKYAALTEHLDDGVGRVLEAIEQNGMGDNTIVIFFSDNGGEIRMKLTSNLPLRDGKVTQYQGGYRVPMFVKWPGVTKGGSVCEERVAGHDFYPTILAMTGTAGDAKHNANVDGLDLTPLLKNPKAKLGRDELHWLHYMLIVHYKPTNPAKLGPCASMIKGDWKIMEFFELPEPSTQKDYFELYNIKDDPYEQHDLAGKMPEKVEELKKRMYAWRKEVNAPAYNKDWYKKKKKK